MKWPLGEHEAVDGGSSVVASRCSSVTTYGSTADPVPVTTTSPAPVTEQLHSDAQTAQATRLGYHSPLKRSGGPCTLDLRRISSCHYSRTQAGPLDGLLGR